MSETEEEVERKLLLLLARMAALASVGRAEASLWVQGPLSQATSRELHLEWNSSGIRNGSVTNSGSTC